MDIAGVIVCNGNVTAYAVGSRVSTPLCLKKQNSHSSTYCSCWTACVDTVLFVRSVKFKPVGFGCWAKRPLVSFAIVVDAGGGCGSCTAFAILFNAALLAVVLSGIGAVRPWWWCWW